MPINIGKNLKIEPTNDTKVSKFVRNYNQIHSYIDEKYQSEESNILLFDLLTSLLPSAVISYSNLPSGATFEWKIGSETLSNPANVKEGQVVEYTLIYSDGSECVDSFVVSGDYTLDLSSLEPNKFILTITANKTLKEVHVYHNYVDSSSPYILYTTFDNNTLKEVCDKNENIRISACVDGWSQNDKNTSPMNLSIAHYYNNITSNISETYAFDYVAYNSARIFLKDENNNPVALDNTWLQYITWSPSDATKFKDIGIVDRNPPYYNAYFANTITLDYTINVPNYGPITGTFSPTSLPEYNPIEQTKTLVPMVTYTIVPYPSDATVTLAASGYTQVGNSITVPKGSTVVWMVVKNGYETQSGNAVVNSTQTSNVVLVEEPKIRTFALGRYPYGDSYLTDIVYNISDSATVLPLRCYDTNIGDSALCDNNQIKIYTNANGTLQTTQTGTPKTGNVIMDRPGGSYGPIYEEIQTTSNTVLEFIQGLGVQTLSITSDRELVGLIHGGGTYTYDNYCVLLFKGNSNNAWQRYVKSEDLSTTKYPTTGTWKTVNINIQCCDNRPLPYEEKYVGTSSGLYTISISSGTISTSSKVTGYNIIDLIVNTTNNVDTVHFITSDGKLYKYISSNNSVTLVNDTYTWSKIIQTSMYMGALSSDGHVLYWNLGSSYIITSESGYSYDGTGDYSQIKDGQIYQIGKDNVDTSFSLKYDVVTSTVPYTGFGCGAIRYTRGS